GRYPHPSPIPHLLLFLTLSRNGILSGIARHLSQSSPLRCSRALITPPPVPALLIRSATAGNFLRTTAAVPRFRYFHAKIARQRIPLPAHKKTFDALTAEGMKKSTKNTLAAASMCGSVSTSAVDAGQCVSCPLSMCILLLLSLI